MAAVFGPPGDVEHGRRPGRGDAAAVGRCGRGLGVGRRRGPSPAAAAAVVAAGRRAVVDVGQQRPPGGRRRLRLRRRGLVLRLRNVRVAASLRLARSASVQVYVQQVGLIDLFMNPPSNPLTRVLPILNEQDQIRRPEVRSSQRKTLL